MHECKVYTRSYQRQAYGKHGRVFHGSQSLLYAVFDAIGEAMERGKSGGLALLVDVTSN